MSRVCGAALALALGGVVLLGAPARADDLHAVRACVKGNAPRKSAVQVLEVEARDPSGEVSTSRAKVYWRRLPSGEERLLLRFEAPEDLAGSALLMETPTSGDPVVYLLLPDIGKPQRVYTASQVEGLLRGGAFQLDEIEWFMQIADRADLTLLPGPDRHAGRAVWALEARVPEEPDARYRRVLAFVDRDTCIPLHLEFYADAVDPVKRIEVDPHDVRREGEIWVPRVVTLSNLVTGASSRLRVESIEVDIPLAPSLLTAQALEAGLGRGTRPADPAPRPDSPAGP